MQVRVKLITNFNECISSFTISQLITLVLYCLITFVTHQIFLICKSKFQISERLCFLSLFSLFKNQD